MVVVVVVDVEVEVAEVDVVVAPEAPASVVDDVTLVGVVVMAAEELPPGDTATDVVGVVDACGAMVTVVVVAGDVVVGDGSTAVVKFQSVCDQIPEKAFPAASRNAPASTRMK